MRAHVCEVDEGHGRGMGLPAGGFFALATGATEIRSFAVLLQETGG